MRRVFIWGTGALANQYLSEGNIFGQCDVKGFIDNDPEKQGKTYMGKMIYAPDILLKEKVDQIFIITVKYQEIYQQIVETLNVEGISITPIPNRMAWFSAISKQILLNRYSETADLEIKEVLDYINKNDLHIFNYPFADKYEHLTWQVFYDMACKLFYVIHKGKRMYFARRWNTEEAVTSYYNSILMEQDKDSPHRYLDGTFQVLDGDVVVDVGVAEGNFALEVIDRVSKIYLIETDDEWAEALRETFKPYADKVVIIQKFVTSVDCGQYATLDGLISEPVDFIKMDIEGNEWEALLGARKLIMNSPTLKCAICAYHTDADEILIKHVLDEYGLKCTTTHGYMWYPFTTIRQNDISTRLCRAIVRGIKESVR